VRRVAAATAVIVVLGFGAGCTAGAQPAEPGSGAGAGAADAHRADVELASLPVKGRAPKTGYSRARFGPAWQDVDRNGCDTRNDVLARDLAERTVRPNTHGCVVLAGTFVDPYTGRRLAFDKARPTAVQIDHVVALSDAWQTGAQLWSSDRRLAFANDPRNLQATDGPINQQKGDSDAASWLPPNKTYRCTYAARQVQVKASYELWVTRAEHDALIGVLSHC
jgi:hypothetical protein